VASGHRAALEGVRLDPAEAVAVTLELAERISSGEIPGVPQDVAAIELEAGGWPVVDADRVDGDSPSALAGFLHALLTTAGERPVPGALMLTIARARGEIDLTGYATLADFAAALRRFGPADTRQALAELYARLAPPIEAAAVTDVIVRPESDALEPVSVTSDPVTFPEPESIDVGEEAPIPGGRSPALRVVAIAALLALFFGAGWVVTSIHYSRGSPDAEPSVAARRESTPPPAVADAARNDRVGTTGPVGRRDAERPSVELSAALEGAYAPAFVPPGEGFFFQKGRAASGDAQSSTDRDTQLLRVVDEGAKSYHVRPSPDGAWIAFDSDRDGDRGVYVGRVDGTEVRRVSGAGHAAMPSWSPDGRALAFVKAEADPPGVWNVWHLDLSSKDMRRVTRFSRGLPWGASWFPDGRRIAYSHEDQVIVHDLAAGTTHTFQSPERGRLVRMPVVSPDGTRIVYQVYRDGMWLLDVREGSARRILDDPTAEEFAWDPQGRRVAFHSRRAGGWNIFVMAAGT
jgi:TolB protein